MTNQNVLGKSSLNERLMELAISISNSNVLPTTSVPELMAWFHRLLAHPKNNLVKPLEDHNGKVNSWVDSMRASSPTRTKHGSENRDQTHWTVSIIIY
jgi:trehalose 6-phosphate phosphatase